MDFDKIFIKDCNPTKMGGQAVIEGIMMRGSDRMAIAVRRGDGSINVKETPIKPPSHWMKWPVIRGVVSFVTSLVTGTSTLMYSAEVLEEDLPEEELEEPGKLEKWVTERLGTKAAFNILLYTSVVFALIISIGGFVLLPTWLVGFCGKVIENEIALNLIEGVLRMVMFVLYILVAEHESVRHSGKTAGKFIIAFCDDNRFLGFFFRSHGCVRSIQCDRNCRSQEQCSTSFPNIHMVFLTF